MAVPSRRLKDDIEADLDHHASTVWPQLEEVTVRWRGGYGYVTGHLTEDEALPLCRIGYLGFDNDWQFAMYQASTGTYQDTLLPNGQPTGTVQEALDHACTIHLPLTEDPPN